MREAARIHSLKTAHRELYGNSDITVAYAPGRAEILGSHTDYNHGLTLSTNVSKNLLIAASPRDDQIVRVTSPAMSTETFSFDTSSAAALESAKSSRESKDAWTSYIKGMLWVYARNGMVLRGFDAVIDSTIPAGSGLSSSAALETAISRLIVRHNELPHSNLEQAILAHQAENDYVGVPCGNLDQATVGLASGILLINHRPRDDRQFTASDIEINLSQNYRLVVGYDPDSKHELGDGKYAARRRAIEKALPTLMIATRKYIEGVSEISLRELQENLPYAELRINHHTMPLIKHVLEENIRVRLAARCLALGDVACLSEFMTQSGHSAIYQYRLDEGAPELRYVYETVRNYPESQGVYGIRNMGGGFNATTLALVDADAASDYQQRLKRDYRRKFNRDYQFVDVTQAPAATVLE